MKIRLSDASGNPVASPRLISSSLGSLMVNPDTGRLLVDGGSGSSAAPPLASATIVQFRGGDGVITDDPLKLGVALGLVTAGETYYVRYLSIYWREDNTDIMRFGPTGEATYRPLSPGEEYEIKPGPGEKVDLNSIRVYCPTAAYSGTVSVLWLL